MPFPSFLFTSGVRDGVRFARALEAHPSIHSRTPFSTRRVVDVGIEVCDSRLEAIK
jgi:hypothetical protein